MCSPQDVNICTLPRQVMEFIFGRGALRDSDRDFRGEDVKIDWWRQSNTKKSIGSLGSILFVHDMWTGPFLNDLNRVVIKKSMARLGESIKPIVSEGFEFLTAQRCTVFFWHYVMLKAQQPAYTEVEAVRFRWGYLRPGLQEFSLDLFMSQPETLIRRNLFAKRWSTEVSISKTYNFKQDNE